MTTVDIKFFTKNPEFPANEDAPEELQFSAEVNITSFGTGPSWTSYGGDPGDPPEWEILKIWDSADHLVSPQAAFYPALEVAADKYMEEDFDWSAAESYDPDYD
jgi:hypothetical protein